VLNTITYLSSSSSEEKDRDGRVMKIKWEERLTKMFLVVCHAEIFVSVQIVVSCVHWFVE